MLRIILCDDNDIICDKYLNLLGKVAAEENVEVDVSVYNSGEALIDALSDNVNAVDLIYLDILMGHMNGIETAKKLRAMNCQAEIIFLTSSEEYIFDSFDTSPMHYLLKDEATEDHFHELFVQAVKIITKKSEDVITATVNGVDKEIPIADILYCEMTSDGAQLICVDGTATCQASMAEMEQIMLDQGFARCNPSNLVHLSQIERIGDGKIALVGGKSVPLAKEFEQEVKSAFSMYLTSAL